MLGNFYCVFYISIHVNPVDWFTCQQPCLFYVHMIHVQWVQHFSLEWFWYYFFLLPLMVILSIIAISSLHDQYSHRSFCTLALIDTHPQSTYSDSIPRCPSCIVADLTFSAVKWCSMPVDHKMVLWLCSFPVFLHLYFFCGFCGQPICYEHLWFRFVQHFYVLLVNV